MNRVAGCLPLFYNFVFIFIFDIHVSSPSFVFSSKGLKLKIELENTVDHHVGSHNVVSHCR